MKLNLRLVFATLMFANQAFAMEHPRNENADSIKVQIANQSMYPVLVFRTKKERKNAEISRVHHGQFAFFGPECYERMFMTAETDSEPFRLDNEQDLNIASARGLYKISLSFELTGLKDTNINIILYTYNNERYPSRVTSLENARKVLVIINPDGEIQLVEQEQ